MYSPIRLSWLLLLFLLPATAFCSGGIFTDTVKLDLKGAEQRFADQNITLLIAKSNIDQQKALLLQSKIWENPQIALNRELYNTQSKTFLSHNSNTEFDLQYTQLITTAGKYFKQIQLNKQNVTLSEYQFYDQMRLLKLALVQSFYDLNQNQQKLTVIQEGTSELEKLIEVMQVQVDKGNAARKELVRLQSLMLDYNTEQTELSNQVAEGEADLKQLLNYGGSEYIVTIADSAAELPPKIEALTFDSLESTAEQNRYDLLAANLQSDMGKNAWQLEKMRGAPDLNMGFDFDRLGSAYPNYFGLVVGLPLPLWNFNQGNIKAAKFQYEQYQLEQKSKALEVHSNLMSAYAELLNENKLFKSVDKKYYDSFTELYRNVYDSYKNRTIGLLEFLDYFDSYKSTKFNLIEIETGLLKQAGQLNYETGKDIL
ncbi:MAG TPA: TolC family protein [Chitinophagales bacterium]|nr:TolC family protein [Chitinophagales bacterium]